MVKPTNMKLMMTKHKITRIAIIMTASMLLVNIYFQMIPSDRQSCIEYPIMKFECMLRSQICTKSQFFTAPHLYFMKQLKIKPLQSRKQWEYVYILKALKERGFLVNKKRGLGIGVGNEPLPSYFASKNVYVHATDNAQDANQTKLWADTGQFLNSKRQLNSNRLCTSKQLNKYVTVEYIDAFAALQKYTEQFDFIWSTCVVEHFGGIVKGLNFLTNSVNVLKPGGLSIHTVEFNIHSDTDTLEDYNTITLFRKRDLKNLAAKLKQKG